MSLYETLHPWQKNVVDKFKDRDSYGLFLDMGTGKTIISLAFAEVNKCDKVIVISINSKALEPETLDYSWLWWANRSTIDYELINKKKLFSKKFDFNFQDKSLLLINYESLYSREKDLKVTVKLKKEIELFINSCRGKNVALIIDESHKIKDSSSMQSKAINMIKKLCLIKANKVYSYLLTGTPFTKGFIDLYPQLKFLGCNMTKGAFEDEFCIRDNIRGLMPWCQPIKAYKNVDELFDLVHKYAITIQSEDVQELPEQINVNHLYGQTRCFNLLTYEKLPCKIINEELAKRGLELKPEVKKKINNPFYRNLAYPDVKWMAETSAVLHMRARQASIGFQGNAEDAEYYDKTRFERIRQFLENNEDNYIIFYNYTAELPELYDICEDLGYNIDLYNGEFKSEYFYTQYCKMDIGERMANNKNVIIANFQSGSTGKNWQEYHKCIIASMPIYRDFAQGIKRIHRGGQKFDCIYHWFYQNNWLDNKMKKMLEEKQDYTDDMFADDFKRVEYVEEAE